MENVVDYTFDFSKIEEKILKIVKENFSSVPNKDIQSFISDISCLAISTLEEHVFKCYGEYTSGSKKIEDLDKLEAFTDPDKGYQKQMLDWIEGNKPNISTDFSFTEPQYVKEKYLRTGIIAISVAYALMILVIYSHNNGESLLDVGMNMNHAITSLVALVSLVYCVLKIKTSDSDDQIAKQVTSDVEEWLKKGVCQSRNIIVSFDLK